MTNVAAPLDHQTPLLELGRPHRSRVLRIAFLVLTDLACLVVAWCLAYWAWARPVHGQPPELYAALLPLSMLFILGFARTGLYPGFGLGPAETLRRLCYVILFGFVMLASASFVMQLPHVYSRITFGLAGALSLVLVPLGRVGLNRLAERSDWWSEPVLVVGTGARAQRVIAALGETRGMGYRPVVALSLNSHAGGGEHLRGVPVLGGLEHVEMLVQLGLKIALLEPDDEVDAETLDELQSRFRHVVMLGRFDDLPVEGVEVRNLGGSLGIEYTNNLLKWHNRTFKRGVDLVLGGTLLVLSIPLLLAGALAIRTVSRGPILFRQERVGTGGSRLMVPKLRTMKVRAEEELQEHLESDPALRQEWEARRKLSDDPRLIPGVGRFLRRWSIDELPQLWCVVRGEMSLVGPRPLPRYHLRDFPPSFRRLRGRVRPGLTGMWQVTIRGDGDLDEQQALDSYYIRNWSFWLDLHLLIRTVTAVLAGRGAY